MKYQPVVDLWEPGCADALRAGTLRLQSGQWVRCGQGPLSRFDAVNAYHIRVFHGATASEAGRKYRLYKARERIHGA